MIQHYKFTAITTAAFCWSSRLEGKYIQEQHFTNSGECYGFEQAKAMCEKASDCYGIATQSNFCGGLYRVTHGTQATLIDYANWRSYNIWAYTLDRSCQGNLLCYYTDCMNKHLVLFYYTCILLSILSTISARLQ